MGEFNMQRLATFQAIKKAENAEKRLLDLREQLKRYVSSLEHIKLPRYSGWFICLANDPTSPSGYKFVGFFNPDECEEIDEPEWNVVVPIWDMETIPEFMGW